jgi:hypothetical protein
MKFVLILLATVLASFTTVISAGMILVFLLIPSSALVSNALHSGKVSVIASDAVFFVVLVVATVAGAGTLVTVIRQTSAGKSGLVTGAVAIAGAAATIDLATDVAIAGHRARSIWWFDVLLIALAFVYWQCQRAPR